MHLKTCACGLNRKSKFETKRAATRCWRHTSFLCVIYDTVRGYISTILIFMGWMETQSPRPPHFRWGSSLQTAALWKADRLTSPVARTLWSLFKNFTLYLFWHKTVRKNKVYKNVFFKTFFYVYILIWINKICSDEILCWWFADNAVLYCITLQSDLCTKLKMTSWFLKLRVLCFLLLT